MTANKPSTKKLGLFTAAIAWLYGLPSVEAETLSLSCQVYDIGMLALPEELRVTPFNEMSETNQREFLAYPELGAKLFDESDTLLLQQAYNICATHRERFDGTGAPHGLIGNAIPIESRMFSIAYMIVETIAKHPADPYPHIVKALKDNSHSALDPNIVEKLLESPETLEESIRELS